MSHTHKSHHWNLILVFALAGLLAFLVGSHLIPNLTNSAILGIELLFGLLIGFDLWIQKHEHAEGNQPKTQTKWQYACLVPLSVLFWNSSWSTALVACIALPIKFGIAVPAIRRFRYQDSHGMLSNGYKTLLAAGVGFAMVQIMTYIWMYLTEPKSEDPFTNYTMALYYVITTIATVGYGDIVPNTNLSRYYAMSLEIIGVGVFGLIISQLSRVFLSSDKRTEHAKAQLELLATICKQYDVPMELRNKSLKFYKYLHSKSTNEDEQKVFSILPQAMQDELRTSMNAFLISKVVLFKGCSRTCLNAAAKLLEHKFYAPGENLIKKGDSAHDMYLIGHGSVLIHAGEHKIASLRDGQCFGEMALLTGELRTADATAQSYSDIYLLSKDNLFHLCDEYADLKTNVSAILKERQAQGQVKTKASGAA